MTGLETVVDCSNSTMQWKNEGTLKICHRPVTDEDIPTITNRLPLQELHFRDCSIDRGFLQNLVDATWKMKKWNQVVIKKH